VGLTVGNVAGIDWASEQHDVWVSDGAGEGVLAATYAHDEAGLSSLCKVLTRLRVELVAVERPDGLLVERLLDAGLRVLAIHPNQMAATRDRFRAAGGKSDRFDSFVLCELARTDAHRFRVLEPDSDETQALKALTRARQDIVASMTAASNQLRAELERCWTGPLHLFSDLDSQISLAFIKRYPSAADTRGLGEQRLAGFLKAQRYTGNQTPAGLLQKLRAAPEGRAGQAESAARRAIVLTLVAQLQCLHTQLKALEKRIASAVRAHPDGEIFLSPFKSPQSFVTAADSSPRSETAANATRHASHYRPTAGSQPSRSNRASARSLAFVTRATGACASRSACSLIARATTIRGRRRSTPQR
jgi:transposase